MVRERVARPHRRRQYGARRLQLDVEEGEAPSQVAAPTHEPVEEHGRFHGLWELFGVTSPCQIVEETRRTTARQTGRVASTHSSRQGTGDGRADTQSVTPTSGTPRARARGAARCCQ